MLWYYSGENRQQLGPVDEASLADLIRAGTVTRSTLVWNEALPDWIPVSETPLQRFVPEGEPKVVPSLGNTPPGLPATQVRDPSKVYPRVPARSPHVAWLNLLFPGIGQLLLGQTGKGILLLLFTPCIWIGALISGGVGFFVLVVVLADAFMVGSVLQSGRPVGRWQFFPR